ncbi:uncharacterized protein TNCV_540981 [Trichonephila clavipes]|nr:uncharacterized protein TNCV_540981 [Trichonephila clavipes]
MAGYQDLSEFERGVKPAHERWEIASPRIIKRATRPQIAADFNPWPPRSVTIQRNIIDMGFWSRRPTRVPLGTALVAAVAEWYRYRTVACFVTGLSPVPLKTRRVGQRCTLNLSRAETSSRWCGGVVRRGGVVHVT